MIKFNSTMVRKPSYNTVKDVKPFYNIVVSSLVVEHQFSFVFMVRKIMTSDESSTLKK